MRRCVCPGSYDPVTNGHVDVIERASRLYDEVVAAILVNPSKNARFSPEARDEMLREATAHLPNVTVDSFSGLLVEYCRAREVDVVVKGLRPGGDFDYELQMAQMNQHLAGVETLFMATDPAYSFISSTLVKEVATYGGDVAALVPKAVLRRLQPGDGTTATGGGAPSSSA
ncbi:MAG: pantetheine-phosphate adenylyltransferase [Chloroflexota bacterium]|nr:pantetheine-phosphate adenylyltransferase [Chloroflexota bacterium]